MDKTILLSFDETLYDEVQAVARANHTTAQELFRHVARAMVRCHHATAVEFNRKDYTIPIPMDLVALNTGHVSPATTLESMLNEDGAKNPLAILTSLVADRLRNQERGAEGAKKSDTSPPHR